MKPTRLALIAALVMGAAFSGRALWQTAHPPEPAAAYAALFETHCLSRLAQVQAGSDSHADLPENAGRITRLDAAGLQAIQKRHSCEVKDATRLMTQAQRDAARENILALITEKLPELTKDTDTRSFDLFLGFMTDAPAGDPHRWGIDISRREAMSGDTRQMTTTRLYLPRN